MLSKQVARLDSIIFQSVVSALKNPIHWLYLVIKYPEVFVYFSNSLRVKNCFRQFSLFNFQGSVLPVRKLIKYITNFFVCQVLFSTFCKLFLSFGSISILSNHLRSFRKISPCFPVSSASRETACLLYQLHLRLSTLFPMFFEKISGFFRGYKM